MHELNTLDFFFHERKLGWIRWSGAKATLLNITEFLRYVDDVGLIIRTSVHLKIGQDAVEAGNVIH